MNKPTEKYIHHDIVVNVFSEHKGQHREYCLCHNNCKFFIPDSPNNCPIAQQVFEVDVLRGITTPVMECPKYEQ